jgi:phosphatidylinositol alpha-1,6-mannosyltransferase
MNWAAIAPEWVIVLSNTVGDEFTVGDGSLLREKLGLNGKRVLLTVGRIDSRERYKGHDRVMAAIPELVLQGHDVAYVIIGEGDDRGYLETIALKFGVLERVHFMGGVALETLIEAYRMADLFVMPSTGEGFGIAFLEAMACGTPALGLAVGGANDALADGELGTAISKSELPSALGRLLSTRTDPWVLSRAVGARFGRKLFAERLNSAINRLSANNIC